jgi:hypothetical protein
MASKYQSIEDLIFHGFLTTKVQVGDETIVLKTLNHHELAQIAFRCPIRGDKNYELIFECYIIVYALFIVGGENVLPGRPGNIAELFQAVQDIPANIRHDLLKEIVYLQKAQDLSLRRLEAYSYEPESRHKWAAYRGQRINDPLLSGIDGTDRLGINTHQVAWIYLNDEEDDRLRSEEQWAFSKFVASASNAKGVKKIDEKDKARLKRLQEERERVKSGEKYEGPVKIEARTANELRAQLMADVEGKKDLHDRIIEEYEASIARRKQERRERYQADMEEKRRQADERFAQMSDEELLAGNSGFVTVLTPEQLRQHKEQKAKERFDLVARMKDQRQKVAEVRNADRHVASENIRRIVEQEDGPPTSLELDTDENGPIGPDRAVPPPPRKTGPVDTRPAANPRLGHPQAPSRREDPQAPPQPAPRPPAPKNQAKIVDGVPTYYVGNGGVPAEVADQIGRSQKDERVPSASPSARLTRQYPKDTTRPAPGRSVTKPGHMTHIPTPEEDDFFAGGTTTFGGDAPKDPRKAPGKK